MSSSRLDFANFVYEYPADEQEVIALVLRARANKVPLRVRGSLHSEAEGVLSSAAGAIHVLPHKLQQFEQVLDESGVPICGRYRVGAGMSMGGDPYAPAVPGQGGNVQQDPDKSLFRRLDALSLALPITGGIAHQTISGFLCTGADGGSLTHSIYSAIFGVRFVNGKGEALTAHREPARHSPGAPPLEALIASLGLLGVIVEVEIQAEHRFDIIGLRSTQPTGEADFRVPIKAQAQPQASSLYDFLRKKEYARALWWAVPGVERIEYWEARRLNESEPPEWYTDPNIPSQAAGVPPKPVQAIASLLLYLVRKIAKHTLEDALSKVQFEADYETFIDGLEDAVLSLIGTFPDERLDPEEFRKNVKELRAIILQKEELLAAVKWAPPTGTQVEREPPPSRFLPLSLGERAIATLIVPFAKLSPAPSAGNWNDLDTFPRARCAERFRNTWHEGLPMDGPIDDVLLPVSFTEIWLPFARAPEALEALQEFFDQHRVEGTGTFTTEVYAACASSAWLSPAHGREVIRIDPFWFDGDRQHDRDDREAFFRGFWETLRPFDARLHWGKALPVDYDASGSSWSAYPMLDKFKEAREEQDPERIFLTPYWSKHLGIP